MKTRLSVIGIIMLVLVAMSPSARVEAVQAPPTQGEPKPAHQQGQPPRQDGQNRESGQRRPPFWKDPAIVKETSLTPEQAAQIDKLWHERWKEMTGRDEELRKQETELKRMIAARTVSADVVALQIDRVEAQRTMLYKSRTVMLYRMSLVLTPDQNKAMQAIWDRLFGFSTSGRTDPRGR